MKSSKFARVLIANRGEIASRVAKTLGQMGITSVGLYIPLEKTSPYVSNLDQAIELSANVLSAFLNMDEIVEIAKMQNVDAIHPGYGFLSENEVFARKVVEAGIAWIGPHHDVIASLGNKDQAKALAKSANVPVLENIAETAEYEKDFASKLSTLNLPIIVKPMMGGGGKGMQVLTSLENVDQALEQTRMIAKSAFGDARLMAETFLERPKHIEIQILRDGHGNAYVLGERDCTTQRRHQKIIEEAPSCTLTNEQRKAIYQDAQNLIEKANYTNAGTVEFLLDQSGQHYFMEVNTRLQVEHVVTEMIFDLDLVEKQIQIAQGQEIKLGPLKPEGHAIEMRIYAENVDQAFLPATGVITHVDLPQENAWTRVDHNLQRNMEVSSMFDPMLMKLSVWGQTREEAIAESLFALSQLEIIGVQTNITYIAWVLSHQDFQKATHHTQWTKQTLSAYQKYRETHLDAAVRIWQYQQWENNLAQKSTTAWDDPWNTYEMKHFPKVDLRTWNKQDIQSSYLSFEQDPWIDMHSYYEVGKSSWIVFDSQYYVFDQKKFQSLGAETNLEKQVLAPMTGKIVKVHASKGDAVEKDQVLLEMEAMKMQYKLVSPSSGKVADIHCALEDVVSGDQVLVEIA